MGRLNWNQRQGPEEFDDTAPHEETFEFDYTHSGGAQPWPKGFGPSTIKKAWAKGLVVIAEIDGFPNPVAVRESRWNGAKVFEVLTLEGPRIPRRVFTRADVRGLRSTGEWIEP